jgi:hypothetical protein
MIPDPERLKEVIEEISTTWNLEQRRSYLTNIETAFGKESADQLKQALKVHWQARR